MVGVGGGGRSPRRRGELTKLVRPSPFTDTGKSFVERWVEYDADGDR
jgi:hypothetical protein